jgi:hypothetical protein
MFEFPFDYSSNTPRPERVVKTTRKSAPPKKKAKRKMAQANKKKNRR